MFTGIWQYEHIIREEEATQKRMCFTCPTIAKRESEERKGTFESRMFPQPVEHIHSASTYLPAPQKHPLASPSQRAPETESELDWTPLMLLLGR